MTMSKVERVSSVKYLRFPGSGRALETSWGKRQGRVSSTNLLILA